MTSIILSVPKWALLGITYLIMACLALGLLWICVWIAINTWAGIMDLRINIKNVNGYLRRRDEFEMWMQEHTRKESEQA